MLLTLTDLDFAYGVHPIFNHLNFRIDDKEHIGLIGPNGSGKTTFFKLLTGECAPDSGTVSRRSQLTLGILTQEFKNQDHQTIREIFTEAYAPLIQLEAEIHALQNAIEVAEPAEQNALVLRMTELQERFSDKGGFEMESRIRGVTVGLGFSLDDLDKCFGNFSGGEKTRIALGAKLLENPDLLLLDEPTNYLDFNALNWLESFLNTYNGSFIIISHDRYFLDKVTTRICEIDKLAMVTYNGNYSQYVEKKKRRDAAMDAAYAKQQRELERQKKIARQLRDYNSLQSSKRAASREKAIAKTELLEHSESGIHLHFSFVPKIVSGNDVLMVENLSKSFGSRTLFRDLSFEVHRGERVGIIGPNGIGKTTLFEILIRHLKADSGRVTYGVKVTPGYYAQEPDEALLVPEETLIDAIREIDTHLNDGDIRSILAPFGFRGEDVFQKIGDCSGGEKARVRLAQLMISEANFLLMDEPTNHIDMATREIVEEALQRYEGTLLFISHDRYFLNKMATHILELTPTGMICFEGNYDDYAKWQQKTVNEPASEPIEVITKTQRKHDRQQQKALEAEIRRKKQKLKELEIALESNDAAITELEKKMCAADFYDNPNLAQQITADYHALKEKSASILEEWETLALEMES